jgi:anti-sigma28 factor (negative regulator of flagellin synthesis)
LIRRFSVENRRLAKRPLASAPVQIPGSGADIQQAMFGPSPTGEATRDMKITEIQQMIGRGEYYVEPSAIAEAILRRLAAERRLSVPGLEDAQPECS